MLTLWFSELMLKVKRIMTELLIIKGKDVLGCFLTIWYGKIEGLKTDGYVYKTVHERIIG